MLSGYSRLSSEMPFAEFAAEGISLGQLCENMQVGVENDGCALAKDVKRAI